MTIRTLALGAVAALTLSTGAALAAGGAQSQITDFDFSFEGPFGSYDQLQLQRGLAIYTDVCAACHGLKFLSFRNLGDAGGPALPEDQVYGYAEAVEIYDNSIADYRPASPADHFPVSALDTAPDLTLMAKARAGFSGPYGSGMSQLFRGMGGAEYIASVINGYHEAPECAPEDFGGYYNVAFASGGYPAECMDDHGNHLYPGSWIAMAPPLQGEDVEFADGSVNTVESGAVDIAAFLMWTAEPKLNARKQAGLTGVLFLVLLSVLLYLTNKKLWKPVKKAAKGEV